MLDQQMQQRRFRPSKRHKALNVIAYAPYDSIPSMHTIIPSGRNRVGKAMNNNLPFAFASVLFPFPTSSPIHPSIERYLSVPAEENFLPAQAGLSQSGNSLRAIDRQHGHSDRRQEHQRTR